MDNKRKIYELIDNGKESDIVDFKEIYYHEVKKYDLIKDIISFANNVAVENKYIIFGVSDNERKIIGVDLTTIPDISEINQLIKTYCDPFILIDIEKVQIDGKYIVSIIIKNSNRQQPYVIAKDFQSNNRIVLHEGDIYVRKSANNFRALRNDLEMIYKKRYFVELISLNKRVLFKPIEINRIKKKYCCVPLSIVNNTEHSFVFNSIKIKWLYNDSNVTSEVEFIDDDKEKFKEYPIRIEKKPYALGARSQDIKVLYFSVSDGFCDIIKKKQDGQQKLKLQICMHDAQGVEVKTSFDVDNIMWE